MEAAKPSGATGKSQAWSDRRPGRELRQPQPAVPHPARAEGAYTALAEGPLPGSEGAAGAPRVESGQSGVLVALREHVLDPGPARAGRPDLRPPAQLRAQVRDASLGLFDRDESGAVHGRVPLGDEGRTSEAERDDPRDVGRELRQLVQVAVFLARQSQHQIELEPLEP